MVPETVTVTIHSSFGEEAPLTVDDAMRQLLDFFALLEAAGGEQANLISWQLVEIAMQSPLHATARAVPKVQGVEAGLIARLEKTEVARSIESLTDRHEFPDWMDEPVRARAKSLFVRNANGIGRTDIRFYDDEPLTIIDQRKAREVVSAIEKIEKDRPSLVEDFARSEMGSIEGDVLATGMFRGQPAIQLRERLSGSEPWCSFGPDLAQVVGPEHSWAETWRHRRVLVTGQIAYSREGRVRHIYAHSMQDIDPQPLTYADVADPNFTKGLSISDHLDTIWEDGLA